MKIPRVGVDIAKSVFHVHAVDRRGQKVCEKIEPGAEIGMEACASAHHWARELQKRGYVVKLIAAQFVKPFVKSDKNDRANAEAISEAMSRPSMRFVNPKSIEQQDTQAIHRVRSGLIFRDQQTASMFS